MNKNLIKLFCLFVGFTITSSQIVVAKESVSSLQSKIETFNSELRLSPESIEILWRRANAYFELGRQSHKNKYFHDAETDFKKILHLVPNNQQSLVGLYKTYSKLVEYGNVDSLALVRTTFKEFTPQIQSQIEPPSWIEFWAQINYARKFGNHSIDGTRREEKYKSLLRSAIKEQPNFLDSYTFLGDLYSDDGNHTLAIAITKQALNKSPENPYILTATGEKYLLKLFDDECPYDDEKSLSFAHNYYIKALKHLPKNAYIHSELSSIYNVQGKTQLAINEARTALRLSGSNEDVINLAGLYVTSGKRDKAIQLIEEYGLQNNSISRLTISNYYLTGGNFTEANKFVKPSSVTSIYRYFVKGLIGNQLKNKKGLKYYTEKALQKKKPKNWELELAKFITGDKNYDELLEVANNPCKIIEAQFYHGYHKLLVGETSEANKLFSQVVDNDFTMFYEHWMSKYFLSEVTNTAKIITK